MYKGLTTNVTTNLGTFGTLKDLEKFMRFDGIANVEIFNISVFGSPVDFTSLGRIYTYDEIKKSI